RNLADLFRSEESMPCERPADHGSADTERLAESAVCEAALLHACLKPFAIDALVDDWSRHTRPLLSLHVRFYGFIEHGLYAIVNGPFAAAKRGDEGGECHRKTGKTGSRWLGLSVARRAWRNSSRLQSGVLEASSQDNGRFHPCLENVDDTLARCA